MERILVFGAFLVTVDATHIVPTSGGNALAQLDAMGNIQVFLHDEYLDAHPNQTRRPKPWGAHPLQHRGGAANVNFLHTGQRAAAASEAFRHALRASPTDAKSVKLGSSAGSADVMCGTWLATPGLPTCSASDLKKYRELSKLLKEDPGGMSFLVREAILMGTGGPRNLSNCQIDSFALSEMIQKQPALLQQEGHPVPHRPPKMTAKSRAPKPPAPKAAPPRAAAKAASWHHAPPASGGKGPPGKKPLKRAAPPTSPRSPKGQAVHFMKVLSSRTKAKPGSVMPLKGKSAVPHQVPAVQQATPEDESPEGFLARAPPPLLGGIRLIVDAQYNNVPRCCSPVEAPALRTSNGDYLPWTKKVVRNLRWHTAHICGDAPVSLLEASVEDANDTLELATCTEAFRYVSVWPKEGRCTPEAKCPLVLQIPGEGEMVPGIGDPWMLIQANCAQCAQELHAVIVSPEMPIDLLYPNRSSDAQIRKRMGPLTRALLERFPEVDSSRVYLLAQSRGCDTALRSAFLFPQLFSMVILSGLFGISNETLALARRSALSPQISLLEGRTDRTLLQAIQFHIGDQDATTPPAEFWKAFRELLPDAHQFQIDVRVYPESKHSVWYGAWNSLHEIIWAAARGPRDPMMERVPYTCQAPTVVGADVMAKLFGTLIAGAVLMRLLSGVRSPFSQLKGKPAPAAPATRTTLETKAAASGTVGWVRPKARGEPPAMRLNRERLEGFSSFLDVLQPASGRVAIAAPLGTSPPLVHAHLYQTVASFSLSSFGVKAKSHVATMLPAGDMAAGLLICLMSRFAVAPLSADLRREELIVALQALGVHTVVTTEAVAERIGALPTGITHLVAAPSSDTAGLFELRAADRSPVPSQRGVEGQCALNGPDDVCLLLQTSGTTSKPKTVPVSLRRLVLGSLVYGEAMGLRASDCGLNVMPFYHIGGILTNLLCVLLYGGGVVCAQGMKEEKLIDWLRSHHVTYYSAVPTTHQLVMQIFERDGSAARAGVKLHTIATGAAHLAHPLILRLRAATGATVVPTYGMSECMPISAHTRDYQLDRPESVGRRVGELQLFTEDGQPAPQGTQGEVCVRGPLLMPQYLGGGSATYHGGNWFRTGDVGVLDEDEYLYLVGRSKEVINRGGELISPFEVESVAVTYSEVDRCMAFGAKHEELGETCALAIVPTRSGQAFSLKGLQTFLLEKLSPSKVPELVVLMSEIPKGATGKVQRIGFGDKLGLDPLASDSPLAKRLLEATASSPSGPWEVRAAVDEGAEDQDAVQLPGATDSLGFSRKVQNADDVQATMIQEALYGLCIAKLIFNHWLPHGSITTTVPGQPDWLVAFLTALQDSRTLLVLIFPLLGFFDGREAVHGESPLRRFPMVLCIYMAMAWPTILPSIGGGFATFHRWPLYVWLGAMFFTQASNKLGIPAWLQVVAPLFAAPSFCSTLDNLHEQLALQVAGLPFSAPLTLLLEDRFYYSVGMKMYFFACYSFAYHYLASEAVFKRMMGLVKCNIPCRVAALVAFMVLSFAWEQATTPFDLSLTPELADWPNFLGAGYPLNIAMDWALMFLVVVGVGTGFTLLRLMGQHILGTMICHMYLQLPFSDMIQEAAFLGGPCFILVVLVAVPLLYTLSVGRLFQVLLLSPVTLFSSPKA